MGGRPVTQVIEGRKRFDVVVRMAAPYRSSREAIGNLWISSPEKLQVPLIQVADIRYEQGPPAILRENAQRRVVVQCNIQGRDMGGFVRDAQAAVTTRVPIPAGTFVTWGGQFENQQRAMARFAIIVPITLALVFSMLSMALGSIKNALLIMINIPLALMDGVFGLSSATLLTLLVIPAFHPWFAAPDLQEE